MKAKWGLGVLTAVPVGVAAVALLAGCSSGTASGGRATAGVAWTGSASASSSGAVAAYEAMWRAVVNASTTADYRDPRLAVHSTGLALTTITAVLRYEHDHGVIDRGRLLWYPKAAVFRSMADQIAIDDCTDDTHWLQYRDSGGLVNSTLGGRHKVSAIVSRVGGTWKVSSLEVGGLGTCG